MRPRNSGAKTLNLNGNENFSCSSPKRPNARRGRVDVARQGTGKRAPNEVSETGKALKWLPMAMAITGKGRDGGKERSLSLKATEVGQGLLTAQLRQRVSKGRRRRMVRPSTVLQYIRELCGFHHIMVRLPNNTTIRITKQNT